MSVNQRVREFINLVTVKEILAKTELGKTALYRARKDGGINADTLESICSAYPKLNTEWVLRGSGDMWTEGFVFMKNSEKEESNINELNEPHIGYESGFVVKEVHVPVGKRCSITGGECYADRLTDMERELMVVKEELAMLKKKKK